MLVVCVKRFEPIIEDLGEFRRLVLHTEIELWTLSIQTSKESLSLFLSVLLSLSLAFALALCSERHAHAHWDLR